MHEFSLAESIIDTVKKVAEENKLKRVTKLKLVIGDFTAVHEESLLFALELLSRNTLMEGFDVEIENIPLKIKCESCGSDSTLEELLLMCPQCGSNRVEIISGKEFYIKSIEGDDNGG